MVVDDEPDITFTIQAGLEDGGFDVDAFIDPELRYLASNLAYMIWLLLIL
jgi:DNA-binding response OmpR family regulator